MQRTVSRWYLNTQRGQQNKAWGGVKGKLWDKAALQTTLSDFLSWAAAHKLLAVDRTTAS